MHDPADHDDARSQQRHERVEQVLGATRHDGTNVTADRRARILRAE
jgi:hypothetical protein